MHKLSKICGGTMVLAEFIVVYCTATVTLFILPVKRVSSGP